MHVYIEVNNTPLDAYSFMCKAYRKYKYVLDLSLKTKFMKVYERASHED